MATRGAAHPELGLPRSAVHVSRKIPGSREQVFRVWTDPDQVSRWFGSRVGGVTSAQADLRPGGSYRIEFGQYRRATYAVVGTYLEVEPPERLVYTWAWEPAAGLVGFLGRALDVPLPDGETRVTVEFRDLNGSTEVRLTHELLDTRRNRAFHRFGWNASLARLAALVSH